MPIHSLFAITCTMTCDEHGTRQWPDQTWHDDCCFLGTQLLYSTGADYHRGDLPHLSSRLTLVGQLVSNG